MRNVVRLILIAALAGAQALPALADAPAAGARDVGKIAQEDGFQPRRGLVYIAGPGERSVLPLARILDNIEAQFPGGKHIGVDGPMPIEGRWIYRIKWWMPDGRVLIIFADAQTGQILRVRG